MRLDGRAVLITRPSEQAQPLIERLKAKGATVFCHPVIMIEGVSPEYPQKQAIVDLDQYHSVIFVSKNAVVRGMPALEAYWPQWPTGIHWLAVGQATAAALRAHQIIAQTPQQDFTSEGLLALPCLDPDSVAGQRILIVRGQGGRTTLASTLQARGAMVDLLEVYRRVRATDQVAALERTLSSIGYQASAGAITVVTSVEILDALLALSGNHVKKLLKLPLIVASQRIGDAAQRAGFKDICVARGADDDAIIDAIDARAV